jgi:hypothetical protein
VDARFVLAAMLAATPAFAQQQGPPTTQILQLAAPCSPTEAFLPHLSARWHEETAGEGMADFPGNLITRLWVSPEHTWTVTVTLPNGQSCIVAAGRGWRSAPAGKPTALER